MSKYYIAESNLKATHFYIIFNKKYNVYKFGITSKKINIRLEYYKKEWNITDDMIDILLCKSYENAYNLEKNVAKLLKDNLWTQVIVAGVLECKYKEHFTGYENYVTMLKYLESYERTNRRTDNS